VDEEEAADTVVGGGAVEVADGLGFGAAGPRRGFAGGVGASEGRRTRV
jgi:hypothetical protein